MHYNLQVILSNNYDLILCNANCFLFFFKGIEKNGKDIRKVSPWFACAWPNGLITVSLGFLFMRIELFI